VGELMYTRIVVEVIFPSEDVASNTDDLNSVLVEGLGANYVAHRVIASEAMTEDRCEEILRDMHEPNV
jgi:hypothetical protein